MTTTGFPHHTVESAPSTARPSVEAVVRKQGFLPAPVARMATSPELLGTFLGALGAFDRTSLTPAEREVVVFALATEVECHYCVALHTASLPDGAPVAELRARKPLPDNRSEALRQFALAVWRTRGAVSEEDMAGFLAAGFDHRAALEVVLGIGTYTLSTFANRMTGAPLDPPLERHRWEG